MYVHMYTYMYVYVCIYTYVCMCIICILYTCTYIYMCVYYIYYYYIYYLIASYLIYGSTACFSHIAIWSRHTSILGHTALSHFNSNTIILSDGYPLRDISVIFHYFTNIKNTVVNDHVCMCIYTDICVYM